jgi:hypothetical protein
MDHWNLNRLEVKTSEILNPNKYSIIRCSLFGSSVGSVSTSILSLKNSRPNFLESDIFTFKTNFNMVAPMPCITSHWQTRNVGGSYVSEFCAYKKY